MVPRRKGWALGAIAVIIAALLGWVAWRRTDPAPAEAVSREFDRNAAELFDRGQREYTTIAMRSMRELTDVAGARAALDSVVFLSEPAPPASKSALLDDVAAFLRLRFAAPSFDEYCAWRRASGKELISVGELVSTWCVDDRCPDELGTPYEVSASSEELFRQFWDAAPKWKNGGAWPTKIAAEGKGFVIACGPFSSDAPTNRPSVGGEMPREVWIGNIGGTSQPWWQTPGGKNGRLPDRFRSTQCAEVGMVMEYADGSRRPMVLTFLWDPVLNVWTLQWINLYNYPLEKVGPIEY